MRLHGAVVVATVFTALAAFGVGVHMGFVRVPPGLAPWAPIDLTQPPGFFTRLKLNGLAEDLPACQSVLVRAGVRFTSQPDRPFKDGCGLVGGVRVKTMAARYEPAVVAACPIAAALVVWERHAVQPAARELLDAQVVTIEHLGTYNCRNVNNRKSGSRSQHATANAIDIARFHLSDGRTVSLAKHWTLPGPEAEFLRTVSAGACATFNGVIGPDNDARHANHFHLDMGHYRLCR